MDPLEVVKPFLGLASAAMGAIFYSCTDLLYYHNMSAVDPFLGATYLAIISTVCSIISLIVLRPAAFSPESSLQFTLLNLCGICQGFGQFSLLIAIYLAQPGSAVAVYFTMPMFAIFIGYFVVGNDLNRSDILCTLLSLIGVSLITTGRTHSPTDNSGDSQLFNVYHILGYLAALLAAILHACTLIIRHRIGSIDSIVVVVVYQVYFICASVSACALFGEWKWIDNLQDQIWLFSSGFSGFVGVVFLLSAASLEQPGKVSIILTLQIICTQIGQILFLGIPLDWMSLFGSLLVTSSCIGVALARLVQSNEEEQDERMGDENLDLLTTEH